MTTQNSLKELISNMSAEQKAENLKTLQYIKTIANSSNTDISNWDILKIFMQPDGAKLISDKQKLNKLFFEYLPKAKEEFKQVAQEENETTELNTASLLGVFKGNATRIRAELVRKKESDVYSCKSRMEGYWQNYLVQQRSFVEMTQELNLLKVKEEDLSSYNKVIDGIKKVISDGLFINPVFEDGCLYLNTKSNIILRHVNKQANLDVLLDIGQLAVKINTKESFNFSVIPYKNNIVGNSGYYHPHIRSDSGICWGEAQNLASQQVANLELDKALRLLHALLNSYNPASPYTVIQTLRAEAKKINYATLAGNLRHPDLLKQSKIKTVATNKEVSDAMPSNAVISATIQTQRPETTLNMSIFTGIDATVAIP